MAIDTAANLVAAFASSQSIRTVLPIAVDDSITIEDRYTFLGVYYDLDATPPDPPDESAPSSLYVRYRKGATSPPDMSYELDAYFSNSSALPLNVRGVFVGTGGNMKAVLCGDTEAVTFSNIRDGQLLPFAIKQVYAAGTTASDIEGLI